MYAIIMLYDLPEDVQWYIWKLYYARFILTELKEDSERRAATTIQNYVKNMIDEVILNAVNQVI